MRSLAEWLLGAPGPPFRDLISSRRKVPAVGLTTDPDDPRLGHGADTEPQDQHETYLVLSEEERAKGFTRPLYRSYVHHDPECGAVTTMGLALCETYRANPQFYGSTFCCGCLMHRPVGPEGEFTWVDDQGNDTHILVGT